MSYSYFRNCNYIDYVWMNSAVAYLVGANQLETN